MVLIIKLLVIPFANLRKRFKLTKLLMFHFVPQHVRKFNIHSTPSFMLNGHFLPKGFNFMDIINF